MFEFQGLWLGVSRVFFGFGLRVQGVCRVWGFGGP